MHRLGQQSLAQRGQSFAVWRRSVWVYFSYYLHFVYILHIPSILYILHIFAYFCIFFLFLSTSSRIFLFFVAWTMVMKSMTGMLLIIAAETMCRSEWITGTNMPSGEDPIASSGDFAGLCIVLHNVFILHILPILRILHILHILDICFSQCGWIHASQPSSTSAEKVSKFWL